MATTLRKMSTKNKIFIIGNGFDLAHGFKTKFSDFADYYMNYKIIPNLQDLIKNRKGYHPFFKEKFSKAMSAMGGAVNLNNPNEAIWFYVNRNQLDNLEKYLCQNYHILSSILSNELIGRLYAGEDKNWFDIENSYFRELIPLKEEALEYPGQFGTEELHKLNSDFEDIKANVIEYLNTIDIKTNSEIKDFLKRELNNSLNNYVINFNYTSTVRMYLEDMENSKKTIINHIHGSLEDNNIIFGYGNDENTDYQEMKNLEIDDFLTFFKTFDYMNHSNYDRVYSEALDKYEDYEVLVLGHSLGLTDKTLLSEILNSDKCKKISVFKRGDLKNNSEDLKYAYRELIYSASRIMTNEKTLRKKIVNYENSTFFV